jgi:hypothetical protein
MNRDVAIIKIHSYVSGGYLTAFLRSRFGAYQLAREGSGGVQQMITLGRLRNVQVVVLPQELRDEVAAIHVGGLEGRKESERLFLEGERLLEAELGLNKLMFQKPVGYTAKFSELETSHRSDAQHYHSADRKFGRRYERCPEITVGKQSPMDSPNPGPLVKFNFLIDQGQGFRRLRTAFVLDTLLTD